MTESLLKEFEYFRKVHQDLVEKYDGRFVVIHDCTVVKDFEDEMDAVDWALKSFEPRTFIVQFVAPGDSAYTQNFHSRVAFS